MNCLVVCQTPLHFFLSCYIIEIGKNNSAPQYIWIHERPINPEFLKRVLDFTNGKLLELPGANCLKPTIKRPIQRMLNIATLKARGIGKNSNSITVFHDSTPETQYLINRVHSRGGLTILGEDGVALYDTGGCLSVSFLKKILGRLLYGFWWSPKEYLGLHEKIDKIYATIPEILRKDIQCNKVDRFFLDKDRQEILEQKFVDILPDLRNHAMCLLPPMLVSPDSPLVTDLIDSAQNYAPNLALKFHPRQSSSVIESFSKKLSSNAFILPHDMPAEIFCIGENRPKVIIGIRSSALHIMSYLFPDIPIYFFESASLDFFESTSPGNMELWRKFYHAARIKEVRRGEE